MSAAGAGPRQRLGEGVRRARHIAAPASSLPFRYSVLATACVAPPPHPGLQRSDPLVRKQDYLSALGELAVLNDPRVGALVILENSGADPDAFIHDLLESLGPKPLRRSVEMVSWLAPPRPPKMHYGHAEFQMIDSLMDRSTLLSQHFIKVTGRYRFPNLPRLLDRLGTPPSFLCDAQDIPALPGRKAAQTANMSMFIANRQFYDHRIRHLYKQMQEVPRRTHVENLIYDELRAEHSLGGAVCLRLPVNCEPEGVGGNGEVLSSPARRVKSAIRGWLRGIAPQVWL